jgi:hypothetical protein
MTELHPVICQNLADEQAAMALLRLALAAKKRDAMLPTTAQQTLNGHPERGLLGHAVIASAAMLVVICFSRWPTAELLSEEEVAHASFAESHIQLLAVELRRDARVWVRAHVHHDFDALGAQELGKPLECVVRMSDRPDSRR